MIDAILNLLFPTTCVVCHNPVLERRHGPACPDCWQKLELLPRPICPCCGLHVAAIEGPCGACRRGDHAFDFARSPFLFNDTLREIIHNFKYSDRVSFARPLGELLKDYIKSEAFLAKVVIPVPLHRARLRRRGFNQAQLLSERLGLEVRHLLRRRKNTPSQTGLSRSQRVLNLSGAFEVRGDPPDCVLVIDDVYTTGSTMHEIAKTLKRAGVTRVEALTVARVPRPESGL